MVYVDKVPGDGVDQRLSINFTVWRFSYLLLHFFAALHRFLPPPNCSFTRWSYGHPSPTPVLCAGRRYQGASSAHLLDSANSSKCDHIRAWSFREGSTAQPETPQAIPRRPSLVVSLT
ncbi:hypothetical protein J6590_087202 [Homalodisca vitripennis]|nr:hypothetical protein J6590_087202 [Homalodisca vitripennis]